MNPTYQQKQIFALNWLSNCNEGKVFNSQADSDAFAQAQITAALLNPGITGDANVPNSGIGSFSLVWGPYTSASETSASSGEYATDNTMFVAKQVSGKKALYVVAVAGTNVDSHVGWFSEDLQVSQLKPLPWGSHTKNIIASGSALGAHKLINLPATGTTNSIVTAIDNDIKALKDVTDIEVAVSGHSLGGALSPIVAVYLKESLTEKSAKVTAYPSAGPSPGTSDFVTLLSGLDGYHAIFNPMDIVPHAWDQTWMTKLPDLYKGHVKSGTITDACITWAMNQRPSSSTYQQAAFDPSLTLNAAFINLGIIEKLVDEIMHPKKGNGTMEELLKCLTHIYKHYHPKKIDWVGFPESVVRFVSYMAQAGAQHTSVYPNAFFSGFANSTVFLKELTAYTAFTETKTVVQLEEANLLDFVKKVSDSLSSTHHHKAEALEA